MLLEKLLFFVFTVCVSMILFPVHFSTVRFLGRATFQDTFVESFLKII